MSMTTPVVLKTKITPPPLKEALVERTRLLEWIQSGTRGRISLVCAPAGFGKTTLLTQWVYARQASCAWLTLDERDNDPVRFWRYAVYSIAETVPTSMKSKITMLAEGLNGLSLTAFLDAFMNELFELEDTVSWVMDDYHFITNPRIHESLSYFIEYMPQQLTLLISTRRELPFATVKWLTRNESREMNASGLQFTPNETETFYRESEGPQLTERQIRELNERTEGWVTGLQLALLSLQSRQDIDCFIEQFQGSHRNVTDYIFHEVISSLPEEVYDFVLKTSILEQFDARICDAVTEDRESRTKLEHIKKLNLFLIPLDEKNEWFRYHHLFSGSVREYIKRQLPEKWDRLNRLASLEFAKRGYMDEAVEYAITAGDFVWVEELLQGHISALMESGELGNLLRWFESFPSSHALHPEMDLFYAFVLVLTGRFEQAEQRLKAFVEKHQGADPEQWKHLQSGILFVRSNLMFASGDFGNWYTFIGTMLDELLPADPVFYKFNYNVREPYIRRTPLGLSGALSPDMENIGGLYLGVLSSHGLQESLVYYYVKQSLVEGYYEWNRIADSRKALEEMLQAASRIDLPGLLVPILLMRVKLHLLDGHTQLAHDLLEEGLDNAGLHWKEPWVSLLLARKMRLLIKEGKLPAAKKIAAKLGLSTKDKPTFQREYEYLSYVRLLGRQRKEIEALRLLEQLKPQSVRERLVSSSAEISIIQALLEEQLGQRKAALRALHEALLIGERNGYIRSFVDEAAPMHALLTRYTVEAFTEPSSLTEDKGLRELEGVSADYVHSLLQHFSAVETEAAATSPLIEQFSRSETVLLQLIRKGASNKQIAAELALSEGTVKVYLSRLYEKLGVSSRTQALRAAQELGLLL
ncbi:LuxR C-terminal-related transcriptional regulator [Paenibacillus dokdonensis]|uniref:LuxR C-terminal-related transcriptional regulator n=1 Tax=Paenibacillus dokdonensis TaxID=2567944 RepID=A0ABU6GPF0_9BACL|nr:LuxR C-terminal-related transcriptional regulator [Paenibacillus dokdonensis]MEC0241118.1 LuxR C-terminal-related transcriptional regulator [Paenibacillus dokdonensis]